MSRALGKLFLLEGSLRLGGSWPSQAGLGGSTRFFSLRLGNLGR